MAKNIAPSNAKKTVVLKVKKLLESNKKVLTIAQIQNIKYLREKKDKSCTLMLS